jgi:hypothetical protein
MGNGMLHRGARNTFKEKARIPHSQDMDMQSMQLGCIIPRRILDKGKGKETTSDFSPAYCREPTNASLGPT